MKLKLFFRLRLLALAPPVKKARPGYLIPRREYQERAPSPSRRDEPPRRQPDTPRGPGGYKKGPGAKNSSSY